MSPSKSKTIIVLAVAAVASLSLLGFALFRDNILKPAASSNLRVAATIFPLADITRQVGGEYVDIELIVPPGVSEHNEALTPQQLAALQSTQTIFAIGQGLDDGLLTQVQKTLGEVPIVTVDQGIALREFGDPHYWLTVPNAKLITQTIANTLIELDPANSTHYQLQTTNYLKQLDDLEIELQQMAESADRKQFIAMHDAWSYFAAHYGFELVATYEPIEGQEPTVADIQRLQATTAEHGIQTFYSEPQKQTSAAIRFLREELGLTIKVLDPVGGIDERDSYLNLMRANMQALSSPT